MVGLTSAPAGVAVVPPREGMTTTQLSGLEVYNRQGCAACHTIDGVGGTGGPGLSRAGYALRGLDMRGQIVTPGRPAKMPAYPRLSEQDLNDLVEYLVSLQ